MLCFLREKVTILTEKFGNYFQQNLTLFSRKSVNFYGKIQRFSLENLMFSVEESDDLYRNI